MQLSRILNSSSSLQSLAIPYHPVYSHSKQELLSRPAFSCCSRAKQGLRAVLSWGMLSPCAFQSRVPSTDVHSWTPDTAGEEAEQKWWLWKPVLESRHSSVVWSRMHSQALPGEHRRDFCPWCLSGGWAAGARGCPGGELCSALHTRLPEPVPSLASERAPLILERIWSLWSKQWVKQAVFWSVFSKGLLPSSGIPQTLSLALFLKWNYGLLCGFVQGSLLTGLSGVISSLFMDEAKHKANWKSCISTWTVHKQKDGASWWWWLMQWGCWGNPHHWMTLQKVRRGDSSV